MDAPVLDTDVRHAFAMRGIDEIQRRGGDEVPKARLRADIVFQMGQQRMALRFVEQTPSLIAT